MVSVTVDKGSIRKMRKRLDRLDRRESTRLIRRANRAGLQPILKSARRRAPKQSGKLRKSLAIQNTKRIQRGNVVSKIWPRPKFKSKGLNNDAPIDIAERRAGHPRTYAFYIEKGKTKSGGRLRRAGPAKYLEKSYNQEKLNAVDAFGRKLWEDIDKSIRKGS